MKNNNIDLFIENCYNKVKLDKKFFTELEKFRVNWTFKHVDDGDHTDFLSSNLLGVHRLVFSRDDDERLLRDVFNTSISKILNESRILNIPKDFKLANNPVYITLIIFMYKIYQEYNLKDFGITNVNKFEYVKGKNIYLDGLVNLFRIFSYKCLSSIINHYCKFQTDEAIARAVYEKLTDKYLIKKLGSWEELINYRSNNILPNGIFTDKIIELDTENLIYVIQGIKGRYNEIIQNIFVILMEVYENKERILSTKQVIKDGEDGEDKLNDVINTNLKYTQYIKSIINRPETFIDFRLINYIQNLLSNLNKEKFQLILELISNSNYSSRPEDDYLEGIMSCSFSYLNIKGINHDFDRQLHTSMKLLRGLWSAGNIKDVTALETKKMVLEMVQDVLGTTNKNVVPVLAMGFLLYVYAKAIKG